MSDDFPSFVRSMGIRPLKPISPDGKWYRCPTESHPKRRNGAYKLALDGRIGWAQDWAHHDSPVTWRAGEDADVPEFDPGKMRAAWREHDRKRKAAIQAAREFYAQCEPLRGGHPYLEAHGLDMRGCKGLKVDGEGWLVVPALKGTAMQSLQRIAPDGTKRFWKGAPVAGTAYTVDRRAATVNVLCEGLATGLACFAALPTCRVIVAWNAGNLSKVDVPPGLTVVAADNDHGTEEERGFNPGIQAAQEAAEEIGCGIAFPEGIEGTDWADYREERTEQMNQRKQPHQTRGELRRIVDGEIGRALMRGARFVAREVA